MCNLPIIHWFYGRTNTGKTETIRRMIDDKIYKSRDNEICSVLNNYRETNFNYNTDSDLIFDNSKYLVIDNLFTPEDGDNRIDFIKLLLNHNNRMIIHVRYQGFKIISPKEIFISSIFDPKYFNIDDYPNLDAIQFKNKFV